MTIAHHAARRPELASTTVRITSLALSAVMTLALLASMGRIADRQVDDALLVQAGAASSQVVVVKGQRLPRG
jgi:hypothetical protein